MGTERPGWDPHCRRVDKEGAACELFCSEGFACVGSNNGRNFGFCKRTPDQEGVACGGRPGCTNGFVCRFPEGRCRVPRALALGELCPAESLTIPRDRCAPGSYCKAGDAVRSQQCAPLVDDGDACVSDRDCRSHACEVGRCGPVRACAAVVVE